MSKKKTEELSARTVLIEVPISDVMPPTEFQLHIDLKLQPPLATTLRRVAAQLDKDQVTLKSTGRRVVTPTDALKYLVEQCSN